MVSYIHPESALAQDKLPKDSLLYGDVLQTEIQATILTGQLAQPVRPPENRIVHNTDDMLDVPSLLFLEFHARGYDFTVSKDARDRQGRPIGGLAITTPRNTGNEGAYLYSEAGKHPVTDLLYSMSGILSNMALFAQRPSAVGEFSSDLNQKVAAVFPGHADIHGISVRGLLSAYVLDTWRMDIKGFERNGASMDAITQQYNALRQNTKLHPFTAEELGAIAAKAVKDALGASPKADTNSVNLPNAHRKKRYGQP